MLLVNTENTVMMTMKTLSQPSGHASTSVSATLKFAVYNFLRK